MRLSSIEANEVGDDFVSAAADCEHLCPQFHPALQSGSDAVLRRMRRRYSVSRFLEKLERVRDGIPGVAFTTDVIVGFPGETDDEFDQTLDACRRARFMKIHSFPFSPRKGTPAGDFAGQVRPDVRKHRMRRLAELERDLATAYYGTLVGRELQVLVERPSEHRAGFVRGTDRTYTPVELPGGADDVGKFVTARGERVFKEYLAAKRL
jgi:threonylcarbamoyladenosine tRNA methylthiotransferase MtaB